MSCLQNACHAMLLQSVFFTAPLPVMPCHVSCPSCLTMFLKGSREKRRRGRKGRAWHVCHSEAWEEESMLGRKFLKTKLCSHIIVEVSEQCVSKSWFQSKGSSKVSAEQSFKVSKELFLSVCLFQGFKSCLFMVRPGILLSSSPCPSPCFPQALTRPPPGLTSPPGGMK